MNNSVSYQMHEPLDEIDYILRKMKQDGILYKLIYEKKKHMLNMDGDNGKTLNIRI